MRNLFRAEWEKIGGNRWVVSCLIWIFPVGAFAFVLMASLVLSLSSSARASVRGDQAMEWTAQAIGVWNFPSNLLGRLLLLGFTAVVFAGEYQWNTWKNIVPRNHRAALILVKFVALGSYVVVAFVLMSIIWTLGGGLLSWIAGASYGPELSGKVVADFIHDYTIAAALAFTSTIIAAGYAALAGMLTRSILGGILVGIGVTIAEQLLFVGMMLIEYFLGIRHFVYLYRLTPGYNLLNAATWVNDHHANQITVDLGKGINYAFQDTLLTSVAILAVWVVGLITLTAYLFRRQDITG
jgi:ABC-type transport system involved in multi-copper enzyme maturation permease subunit